MDELITKIEMVVGTVFPLLGFAVSLSDISLILKIISLVIGCAVGVVSFLHIQEKRKYEKEKRNEKIDSDV